MKRGIVYITNNVCDEEILNSVRKRLLRIRDMDIVSVSHKPIDFGRNIVVEFPSCAESIIRQLFIGAEKSNADLLYIAEHDVLYHGSHFEFVPNLKHHFCYNINVWQVDYLTGKAMFRMSKRTSQLVVYRDAFLEYMDEWIRIIDRDGYNKYMGVSPKSHKINGLTSAGLKRFSSFAPNIDIRHNDNFSNFVYTNEINSDGVPLWGKTINNFNKYLYEFN